MIKVLIGDIFESQAQTLVNTVNTVGVMGKGVALGFRKHFPDMYSDYVKRCASHEVVLGRPYLYRRVVAPNVINFPTKEHWRSVSRISNIVEGLNFLKAHISEWGVRSLAVPPLGCGEGQLEWRVVGPTLYRGLSDFNIPVELYAPFGTPHAELQAEFLVPAKRQFDTVWQSAPSFRIEPGWVALAVILERVTQERYHFPIGRIGFQKLAYFATEVGIPTGLTYGRGSYGPYSAEVKQVLTRLINNGLIVERKRGQMLAAEVGPTLRDAIQAYGEFIEQWRAQIDCVVDLVVRMSTDDAEIAATVHFAASKLQESLCRRPSEEEVLDYVMEWKIRRRPPLEMSDVAIAIRRLNVLGWIDAAACGNLPLIEEEMIA
jgi:uncharacterized protein YwgA/O-acetyl-ADP-ribose deacetylase (regulator of RNase III)